MAPSRVERHNARRVLGRIPPDAIPNDPFWLPGRTVDIDVVSTGREFAATIRSLDSNDEQETDRAKAFVEGAQARRLSTREGSGPHHEGVRKSRTHSLCVFVNGLLTAQRRVLIQIVS
jgi:hypothetical protein